MGIEVSTYDVRAGVYTRPGHIKYEDMEKITDEIKKSPPLNQTFHIKDIERTLYKEIQRLNLYLLTNMT